MDINIIAISVAGIGPTPITGIVARFLGGSKQEIITLAEQGKLADLQLLYHGIEEGSKNEKSLCLKLSLEDIGAGKKVVGLQEIHFGYKKGGMLFTDLAYNF